MSRVRRVCASPTDRDKFDAVEFGKLVQDKAIVNVDIPDEVKGRHAQPFPSLNWLLSAAWHDPTDALCLPWLCGVL